MRYKTFKIVADVIDFDVYNEDVPMLGDIEVHKVVISNTPPNYHLLNPVHVVVDENHPYFNFDIWANEVDFLDEDYHTPHNSYMFRGAEAVNDIIAEYFPSVIDYYKHQI